MSRVASQTDDSAACDPSGAVTDGRSRARIATDRKIDRAVTRIVVDEGPSAVTVSRVSEVSGVARTTLYRRYDSSADILMDVAGRIAPMASITPTLDQQGFEDLLSQIQRAFQSDGVLSLIGHILNTDDEFKDQWRDRFVGQRLSGIRRFLDDGIAAGILSPGTDIELTVEFIVGSAIAEGVLRGQISDTWAQRVAQMLWPTLRA